RALLAVDLDVDEQLVHQRRDLFVFEALMSHHMAPVAGRVADREKDRLVLLARLAQRLFAPGVPIDRVVGMLQQVGARLVRQSVRHGGNLQWSSRGLVLQGYAPSATTLA